MIYALILIYGIAMSLCGYFLATWAIPFARRAPLRDALRQRAYEAALASILRWNIGVYRSENQARAFADGWVAMIPNYNNDFAAINAALDEWIARAEDTNNLLTMPAEDALSVVKKFKDTRFPHLRRRA